MTLGLGIGIGFGGGLAISPTARFGSDLALWLPADASTITVTGSGVSEWRDQSGRGDANRNALQGTDALRPIYTAADANYNNKHSLKCSAAARFLATGVWSQNYSQPTTIFVAGRLDTAGSRLYDGSSAVGGSRQACLVNSDKWGGYAGAAADSTVLATTRAVCAILFNGASSSIYVTDPTTPNVSGVNLGTNTIDRLGILNTSDAAIGASNCEIAEIFVVARLCSAGDVLFGMNYLKAKLGL